MGTFRRIATGRFAVFWLATAFAYVTGEITKLLFPLLAADPTRSPFRVSLVAFALSAPWLVASLPAGALVDRLDRRGILLGVNAARVAVLTTLALLWPLDLVSLRCWHWRRSPTASARRSSSRRRRRLRQWSSRGMGWSARTRG